MPENNDQPVTRRELQEVIDKALDGVVERVVERVVGIVIEKVNAATQEFVRDAQSEILRGFHAFEQNRDLRFKRLKAEVSNLDQEANGRIDNIEHRLMAIEKKLLLDPPRPQ
jgi:hypothetical protein